MDSPNSRGNRALNEHLLSTNEATNSSNELYIIEFWAKGSHGKL